MIPNGHITIYNKYIDNRAEKYQRSEIRDVVWQSTKAIASMRNQQGTNVALVLIPFENHTEYKLPKAWQANKTNSWTLQEGDVVVRGIVTDEITGGFTITSLRAKYDEVFTINSVDAMDEGSPNVQHWEVGLK